MLNQGYTILECIKDLVSYLVKVVRWLLSDHFWLLLKLRNFFKELQNYLHKIRSNCHHHQFFKSSYSLFFNQSFWWNSTKVQLEPLWFWAIFNFQTVTSICKGELFLIKCSNNNNSNSNSNTNTNNNNNNNIKLLIRLLFCVSIFLKHQFLILVFMILLN